MDTTTKMTKIVSDREIDYIKRAFYFSTKQGYRGVDVALDSCKFHSYFKCCDTQEIKKKVEYVLENYYPSDKYEWKYDYNSKSDERGYCAHHITLRLKEY